MKSKGYFVFHGYLGTAELTASPKPEGEQMHPFLLALFLSIPSAPQPPVVLPMPPATKEEQSLDFDCDGTYNPKDQPVLKCSATVGGRPVRAIWKIYQLTGRPEQPVRATDPSNDKTEIVLPETGAFIFEGQVLPLTAHLRFRQIGQWVGLPKGYDFKDYSEANLRALHAWTPETEANFRDFQASTSLQSTPPGQ